MRASWVALAIVWTVGCGDADAGTQDTKGDAQDADLLEDTTGPATWQTPVSGLKGALLSVWGTAHDDLWIVGADARDGTGPIVLHGTTDWRRVDMREADPAGGHLWWVHGLAGGAKLWMVGEGGRAFRVSVAGSAVEAVTRIETGTDATLYGVWGASDAELWAVGGYVYPRTGPPTIVRITPSGGEVVPLPSGLPATGTFFKVWGAAANDVWVVGEQGMVLHWDGVAWTRVAIEGTPRLVTVHGRNASDFVSVGGTSQAVILEGNGTGFVDRSPGPYSLLNGVFVKPDGSAVAVGMLGQVLVREAAGGAWQSLPTTGVTMRDWHAAWVDERGDVWMVGGNLLSAARFDQGTVARRGPARSDVPSGEVVGLDPIVEPDVVEGDAAEGDAEVDAGDVVDVEDLADGNADGDSGPDVDDVADAADVADTEVPDTTDAGDTSDSSDTSDVADTADVADTSPTYDFEIGRVNYDTNAFTPFSSLETVAIVHGPQGGIHVEVAVRYPLEATEPEVLTPIEIHLFVPSIGAVEQARYISLAYPMQRVAAGIYQSYAIPLPFDQLDSRVYDGLHATIEFTLKPKAGVEWRRSIEVLMEDSFF